MDIKKYIKESHDYFVAAGEYVCPECGGEGRIDSEPLEGIGRMIQMTEECPSCAGTRIDPDKNIGDLLMRIIEKLSAANVAWRKRKFAYKENDIYIIKDLWNNDTFNKDVFEKFYKDTYEDYIAMALIRLFDLCGYLEITPIRTQEIEIKDVPENVGESLLVLVEAVCNFRHEDHQEWAESIIHSLKCFTEKLNIPIEKHIEAKMAYNRAIGGHK